jgi:hypothetical protein
VTSRYAAGKRAALYKLGFLDALDPEDLPAFMALRREMQRQKDLKIQAMNGLPAGGLVTDDYALQA